MPKPTSARNESSSARAALAAVLALSCAACRSSDSFPMRPGGRSGFSDSSSESMSDGTALGSSAPSWRYQTLSWQKLESIEAWLTSSGSSADPELEAEANLQLGEGRLQFARADRVRVPQAVFATRLAAADLVLQRVIAAARASWVQKSRARSGLREVASLRAAAPARPPTAAATPASTAPAMLIPRAAWGAAAPIPGRMKPADARWTRLTVHHSALAAGELARLGRDQAAAAVRELQHSHMNAEGRKYGDVGYHYLIDPSGRVFEGRSLSWEGAHAAGANNERNIGVCLLGNFDEEAPTAAALATLQGLVEVLRARYGIARTKVYGHREMRSTRCPGEALMRWVEAYRR